MTKDQQLQNVASEIAKCKICKIGKSGLAVSGEGNSDAEIMFVGEAPGKEEAKVGRPFIGRSGKLLRSLINEVGLREEDVYITSPVKYLPNRGTPTSEDILHGKVHFDKQIEIIDPKIIVLLGRVAAEAVLGEKLQVMKEHGKIIERNSRKYFLTIHPAAAIRFVKNKAIIKKDFEFLKSVVS